MTLQKISLHVLQHTSHPGVALGIVRPRMYQMLATRTSDRSTLVHTREADKEERQISSSCQVSAFDILAIHLFLYKDYV